MEGDPGPIQAPDARRRRIWLIATWLVPMAVVAILTATCYDYPYLFDDFEFLGRAQTFRLSYLLPDPNVVFYRPLSREIFFTLVYSLGPNGPFWGHVIDVSLLLLSIFLLVRMVSQLAGPRAGFFSGMALAAFSQTPILVAWLSLTQDLLAIVLILLALQFRVAGRFALSVLTLIAALLAKETALVLVPVLAGLDWILERRPRRTRRNLAVYGAVVLLWIAIHPGIRALMATGFQRTPGGYVGLDSPGRWHSLAMGFAALLNLPPSGHPGPWPTLLTWPLVLALLATGSGLWLLARHAPVDPAPNLAAPKQVLILGALLSAMPLLLVSFLVRYWAPYYACIPFLGIAVILGVGLQRLSARASALALMAFLVIGVWSRWAILPPGVPSERNLRPAAWANRKLQSEFRSLYESFPPHSQICVSVQSKGTESAYAHLLRSQVLRVWYREPTLLTVRPDRRRSSPAKEYLFWVSPKFNVFEIDPISFAHRPQGSAENYLEFQKTLRYYAHGLAASGEVDRAISLLLGMPEPNEIYLDLDHRLAATLLFSQGRDEDALRVLEKLPRARWDTNLAVLEIILGYRQPPGVVLDEFAFRAFGIRADDTDALRTLISQCEAGGRENVADRLARRLLALAPADTQAIAVIERYRNRPGPLRIMPTVEGDSI